MIDPRHTCWWTNRGRTELFLDLERHLLSSAGVSLRVILSALVEPGLTWYSMIHGEHEDDITIVAARDAEATRRPRERYAEGGPVLRRIADLSSVTEYKLTDVAAGQFGLASPQTSQTALADSAPADGVRYLIEAHDDCFVSVHPVDDATIDRLVTQALRLHSYYHRRDLAHDDLVAELVGLLKSHSAVRLEGKPRRGDTISLAVGVPSVPWRQGKTAPQFKNAGSIEFENGLPRLHLHA